MCRLPRSIPALVLIAIYSLIAVSPLAPLALRSATIAHMLTGECVEDCSICGCSPERRANHTCCCWQKKHQHEYDGDQNKPECCKKKYQAKNATPTISSCPCGSNKITAFGRSGQDELLPFLFSPNTLAISEALLNARFSVCRSYWLGEPPEPPPKLT